MIIISLFLLCETVIRISLGLASFWQNSSAGIILPARYRSSEADGTYDAVSIFDSNDLFRAFKLSCFRD